MGFPGRQSEDCQVDAALLEMFVKLRIAVVDILGVPVRLFSPIVKHSSGLILFPE